MSARMLTERSARLFRHPTANVQVTVFGDTAIAIGGGKFKGTDSSGKPMDLHDRFTDTWVKMPDGKWQCVATHASAIKM
jgi:ketosteroid isomerase-like protein